MSLLLHHSFYSRALLTATVVSAFAAFPGQAHPVPARSHQKPPTSSPVFTLSSGTTIVPISTVVSLNPTAKTITVGSYKVQRLTVPKGPKRAYNVRIVPDKLEVVPLAPDAVVMRYQHDLKSSDLKVGDLVTWLAPEPTSDSAKTIMSRGTITIRGGDEEREIRAAFVRVVSLKPFILRAGATPRDKAEVVNLPLIDGRETRIGTLSVSPTTAMAPRAMTVKGARGKMKIPSLLGNMSLTFSFSDPAGLEFDKFTPLTLTEAATALAAKRATIRPEYENNTAGKKQVKRVMVVDSP